MGVHLQLLQLLHLVQHLVHVELGHEELETTVGVGFAAKTEGACGHMRRIGLLTGVSACEHFYSSGKLQTVSQKNGMYCI